MFGGVRHALYHIKQLIFIFDVLTFPIFRFHTGRSECDEKRGMKVLLSLVESGIKPTAVIGPFCSQGSKKYSVNYQEFSNIKCLINYWHEINTKMTL